jgi:hypothetical protein
LGTDARHDGRGGQIALVMSSTRSAAPFAGTSTATGAGIGGIGDVCVGAGDGVVVGIGTVAVGPVTPGIGVGPDAAGVQAARISENENATILRMTPPLQRKTGEWYYQALLRRGGKAGCA